jgi:hypothetical protein
VGDHIGVMIATTVQVEPVGASLTQSGLIGTDVARPDILFPVFAQ